MARKSKGALEHYFGLSSFSTPQKGMTEREKQAAKEAKQKAREQKAAVDEKAEMQRKAGREAKAAERERAEAAKAAARAMEKMEKEDARQAAEQQKNDELAANRALYEAYTKYIDGLDTLHHIGGSVSSWKKRFDEKMQTIPFADPKNGYQVREFSYRKPEFSYASEEEYTKANQKRLDYALADYERKNSGILGFIKRTLASEEDEIIKQKKNELTQEYAKKRKEYDEACVNYEKKLQEFSLSENMRREQYASDLQKSRENHSKSEEKRILFLNNCKKYNDDALDDYILYILSEIRLYIIKFLGYDDKHIGSIYDESIFNYTIDYCVKEKKLYLRISSPSIDCLPKNSFSLSASRGNLQKSALPQKKIDELYRRFLCSFSLMYGLFALQEFPYFSTIYIDLYDEYTNKSTGEAMQNIRINLTIDARKCEHIDFIKTDAIEVYNNFIHEIFFDDAKSKLLFQIKKGLKKFADKSDLKFDFLTINNTFYMEQYNVSTMEFIDIPAGSFIMGTEKRFNHNYRVFRAICADSKNGKIIPLEKCEQLYNNVACERPSHRVTISRPFSLGKYPVTIRQLVEIIGDCQNLTLNLTKNRENDKPFTTTNIAQLIELIDTCLARLNAQSNTYNYRLPTEAEWEYACRAGTITPCFFEDEDKIMLDPTEKFMDAGAIKNLYREIDHTLSDYAVLLPSGTYNSVLMPVGSKRPNPWGLYDMYGSVWELVQDFYAPYPTGHVTDPCCMAGDGRVFRGGGYQSGMAYCRSAVRGRNINVMGFRLARTPRVEK